MIFHEGRVPLKGGEGGEGGRGDSGFEASSPPPSSLPFSRPSPFPSTVLPLNPKPPNLDLEQVFHAIACLPKMGICRVCVKASLSSAEDALTQTRTSMIDILEGQKATTDKINRFLNVGFKHAAGQMVGQNWIGQSGS